MKKFLFILIAAGFVASVSAQKLIDIYKSGSVKLVADNEYAQGNDWDKVFETYNDTLYGRPMGDRKSLVLMPDGSVVVNHAYRNFYTKFSPDGKFETEFGVKKSNGKKLQKTNAIEGIINNSFFTGLDNMGNMVCFDFEGHYTKTLNLDYMTRQMISLPNNKIAVVGWVLWSKKIREFVALVDFNTNEQHIIWEQFTERSDSPAAENKLFNYTYKFKERGMMSINTMPYMRATGMSSPPQIVNVDDRLIIGIPPTGELLVYDLEGNLISEDMIEWPLQYISVEEQKEIQQKAIEKYKSIENPKFANWVSDRENEAALAYFIREMEADLKKISDPIPVPAFSTVIKDSDGNLLFFEFPKEDNANKFNVWIYENDGKFVAQSSFVSGDYQLQINPDKMVFRNGYIYGLQLLKDAEGVPLRLVRFRLTALSD